MRITLTYRNLRKLFVHRNTLVYRLEKIKRLTGLDLREFDDAIIFKVALMVKKYLISNPVKYKAALYIEEQGCSNRHLPQKIMVLREMPIYEI